MSDSVTLAIVLIFSIGVGAQWLAWRLRIPAIIFLVVAGLILGPATSLLQPTEIFGGILRPVIDLCVAVILFEGGLSLRFRELKTSAVGVRRLTYLGVPLNWILGTLAAHYIGGVDWPVALVFGAIIVVTGPTVILPLLRQAGLNRRTASYLKWEGIINDPFGALLAVLVFQFFMYAGEDGGAWTAVAGDLGQALLAGAILGGVTGWLIGHAFRQGMVPEYLKAPGMLAMVLVVYVAANMVQHETGLLAVTIMGITVGNMRLPSIEEMRRFKEYITLLLVSAVFILLTADLQPETIALLDWRGVALILAVMFLVRPLATFLATIRADMEWRQRLLVAWIAPRGIVAAATAGVFAPRMVEAGYPQAELLTPLIFSLILVTVLVHGLSIGPMGRALGLAAGRRRGLLLVGAAPWAVELGRVLKDLEVNVLIADRSWHNLRAARLAGLPVFYGEILSEFAEESVESAPLGWLLAATDNDAYNALVCTTFASEFGRNRIFQLPMGDTGDSEEHDPRGMTHTVRGRIAFHKEALFETLWVRYAQGWTFQKTRLSEEYGYDEFLADRREDALIILLLRPSGEIVLNAVKDGLEPEAGDTVIYFAPPRERAPREARSEDPGEGRQADAGGGPEEER